MSVLGQSVKRVEDYKFLTGKGRYTDDIVLPRMTFASVVRSPHAHANIRGIDSSEAAKADGVVAVLNGEEMAADGIGGLPAGWQVDFKNGDTMKEPPHPPLAVGKVRQTRSPSLSPKPASRPGTRPSSSRSTTRSSTPSSTSSQPRKRGLPSCTRTSPTTSPSTGSSATRRRPTPPSPAPPTSPPSNTPTSA